MSNIEESKIIAEKLISLFRFNCLYRIRGTQVDIETAQSSKEYDKGKELFFRGKNDGYSEMLSKLNDIKYLLDGVNIKYLSEKEREEWFKLKKELLKLK